MIIDFHAHCFDDGVAQRAVAKLAQSAMAEPESDGTADGQLAVMRRDGIDKAVMLSIATKPSQQKNINDFAAGLNGALIGFGSVHPDAPDALDELERIKSLGIKGIKFHPDYQDFFVDDDKMLPIYEKAGALGLISVFHSGKDITYYTPVHCTPQRLARVLGAFGGAPVVAAHWGGYMHWDETEEYLVGLPVYLDTSYAFSHMPITQARKIAKAHGAHRLLFGTDMPWSIPRQELMFVRGLELSSEDEQKVLGENAKGLLGL